MKLTVGLNQYALVYKDLELVDIKTPGQYYYYSFNIFSEKYIFQILDMRDDYINFEGLDILIDKKRDILEKHFHIVEVKSGHLCKIQKNGNFLKFLLPGTYVFGKHIRGFSAKMQQFGRDGSIDQSFFDSIPQEKIDTYQHSISYGSMLYVVNVPDHHIGIVSSSIGSTIFLGAGKHIFIGYEQSFSHTIVDMRTISFELHGQEILTKDTVALRLNAICNYIIKDLKTMHNQISNYQSYMHQIAQLELRKIVAQKTLEELLQDKELLSEKWLSSLSSALSVHGIEVQSAGIKDIIFPGDMREMMNKVVLAEKESQANNIKRRDETATMRSLLNTAKLLDEHPKLARLKELEILEKLLQKVETVSLNQSVEGLLHKLVKIDE